MPLRGTINNENRTADFTDLNQRQSAQSASSAFYFQVSDHAPVLRLRCVTLQRGATVAIADAFRFAAPVQHVELALLTPCTVAAMDGGRIVLEERVLGAGSALVRLL